MRKRNERRIRGEWWGGGFGAVSNKKFLGCQFRFVNFHLGVMIQQLKSMHSTLSLPPFPHCNAMETNSFVVAGVGEVCEKAGCCGLLGKVVVQGGGEVGADVWGEVGEEEREIWVMEREVRWVESSFFEET